jgi:NIMA (never in mitosis gene a)-related kinase
MNNFEELRVVGDGSFSVVYQARRKLDGLLYAIKKVKLSCLTQQEKHNCLSEMWLLARLTHPNIIQYKEAFFEGEHLCLVMEFAESGDFLQFMMHRKKSKKPFT